MFAPAANAVVGGKYRLERPLAQGGMGSVWTAWQIGLERPVAVKFMARYLSSNAVARARFDREAKSAAQLRTPHVVQMHDHGIEDDTPYIVMELLEGEDLNARLRRQKALSLAEAARIALQTAKALRRAQEAGIVHRDMKPANIFLARADDEEIVKVLDFGIARVVEGSPTSVIGESTQSGAVVGSPHYMSPEQARGVGTIDHRADLWSLAVILFRATTGALPFPGQELGDIIISVWNEPHPAPSSLAPHLPAALDGFFARALAKDPAERFQSAMELASAFAAAAGVARFDPALATGEVATPPIGSPIVAPAALSANPTAPVETVGSWPGGSGPTPPSLQLGRPPLDAPSTLGGSHELGPRPASRVPVALWFVAAAGVLALGAGALIMALRSPAPPISADAASTAAPSGAAPVIASASLTASPAAEPPPLPSAAPEASASAVASAASAAPSASAKRPKQGGRKGHDFGY